MSAVEGLGRIGIGAIKLEFVHPLLAYNFYIDGIPGVINAHCKASSLPEVSVSKIPVKFRGRELYYNGTIAKFADWTVTMREDIYYRARTSLETWNNLMANRTMHHGMITPLIQRNLRLYMLIPGTNIPVAEYELINAFPYRIGAINIDQDSDEQVVTYDVTWSIDAWDRKDVNVSDMVSSASTSSV
jgi:hypothetical protein